MSLKYTPANAGTNSSFGIGESKLIYTVPSGFNAKVTYVRMPATGVASTYTLNFNDFVFFQAGASAALNTGFMADGVYLTGGQTIKVVNGADARTISVYVSMILEQNV